MTCPPTPLRAAVSFFCLTSCFAVILVVAGCTLPHLRSPSNALNDSELSSALQELLCRVEPKCVEFRLHVTSSSSQQAEMFPDGRLQLNVGLLLATQDESEIAFILAHEAAHRRLHHQFAQTPERRTQQEVEADANALTAIASAGVDRNAGLRLLKRLFEQAQREAASWAEDPRQTRAPSVSESPSSKPVDEGISQVTARIHALEQANLATARPSSDPVSEQRWQRLLAPYRLKASTE